MELQHRPTGEKTHQCDKCKGKINHFSQANYALGGPLNTGNLPCESLYQLVSAKKGHTGEKTHQCDKCKRKINHFSQGNYALGGHLE